MKKVLVSLLVLTMIFASISGGMISAQETDFATVTSIQTMVHADVWYIAIFTFDDVVGDEYLNSAWYTANGIRASEHNDGVHMDLQRWGTDGYQVAVLFHDNIRPAFELDKDANDVFAFDPIDAEVVYSVDIELPATVDANIRGNIVLSGSSLGIADITNNEDAIVLTFFKAPNEALRVGLHEAFDTAGNPNSGLQVRRDVTLLNKFTLQLTVDSEGKFMLNILNVYYDDFLQAEKVYVNQRAINHINWNTALESKKTDNIKNGTTYNVELGAGWEGHDGVISFFDNFPEDLKVVYDTSALAYTYTNQVINNITDDVTTPAVTTTPGENGGTTAPGDNNGVAAIALIAVIALGSLVVAQKKKLALK